MQKITFIILASIILFSACKETSKNELRENEKVQIDIDQMEIDIISQTLFEIADFHPNQKPFVIKEFDESEKEFKKIVIGQKVKVSTNFSDSKVILI